MLLPVFIRAFSSTRERGLSPSLSPSLHTWGHFPELSTQTPFCLTVSGGGQEAVMWQVLELAPTNKVVWSSEHIPAYVLHRSSARETSNVSVLLT